MGPLAADRRHARVSRAVSVVPLLVVFAEAFSQGWTAYASSLADKPRWSAIRLTLLVAAIVVPINSVFGVLAAWAIAKFQFVGKSVLITLIDLPYSVSPVIAGMIFVLLFGRQGWFGPWLDAHDLHIVFSAVRESSWRRSSSRSRSSPAN